MPDPDTMFSPAPAPSATRRRRRRRHLLSPFSSSAALTSSPSAMSSSAASSPASSAGLSLFSFSRSPSPFHRLLSPLHYASSAVPFAWEHRPGVPKTPARQTPRANSKRAAAKAPRPLPLPPALLLSGSGTGGSKVGAADDCFVVSEELLARERRLRGRARRRQPALAAATLADWLAVLSLCHSCTMSRDCLAGTTPPPRQRAMAKAGWSG